MRSKKLTKVFAIFLAVLMVMTAFPLSTFALEFKEIADGNGIYLVSDTKTAIAPGITEDKIITNNQTNNAQVRGYVVSVDPSKETVGFRAGFTNMEGTWKMSTVRAQAAACEKKYNENVVVGINADIFNMQTGAPLNVLVMNGNVYNEGIGGPYVGTTKDGQFVMGNHLTKEVLGTLKEAVGGFYTLLENGKRVNQDMQTILNPKTAIGKKANGEIVFYVADGRDYPNSVGLNDYDLTTIMIGLGCVDVINLDGGGSTTYLAKVEGADKLECRSKPSDGTERSVSSTFFITSSAKPSGVFDHANLTPNNELYTPGTTVKFDATGVDSSGAAASLPADGKYALAADSADLGTITDDGVFTSNGKTGTVTVNYVSEGAVCGSTSVEIVIPDTLYVPNNEVSLGFEETTTFGIVAKYQYRDVNLKAGDINWAITDENGNDIAAQAGTFDGLTFTTFDGVTITGYVKATLAFDADVNADIKAVIGALPVVMYDFENYTTNKEEADASDGALHYVPSLSMPIFDRSIGTTSAQQAEEFRQQGYPLYCWPNASIEDQKSMKATVVSKEDGEPTRFGNHSLRIDFDYSTYNKSSNSNNYLRVTDQSYFFEGSPSAIGCWVYVPEGTANFALYLNCSNKTGGLSYMPVTKVKGDPSGKAGIDWTGWKYVEFDLSDTTLAAGAGPANAPFGFYQGCGIFWISYQPGGPLGDKTASKIYLDNIQLIYGANTDDTTNPEILSVGTLGDGEIKDGKTVLTNSTNTFMANYKDAEDKYATGIDFSEVKMFIDGIDVTDSCFINEGDEQIFLYDKKLSNGTHHIDIQVADKFGNTTTETRYFTVDTDNDQTEVEFAAVGTPILGKDFTMEFVPSNSTVNTADVKVKVLSNFVEYWNKYEVVAGSNYELNGEAKYDEKTDTISFSVTKKADADSEDNVIARLVAKIPNNVPEGLECTYRITKGAYTMDDGAASSFSGKIKVVCAAPYLVSTDTMVAGAEGGNIYVTDTVGTPIEGANVYLENGTLVGVTDEEGKVYTSNFVSSVGTFSVYAEKDGNRSFIYTTQTFNDGATADGMPAFIKLNTAKDNATSQSISWISSAVASADKAVVLYAEKADYEANGDAAFSTFEGNSALTEFSSSSSAATNYAARINNATIMNLVPDTEYVYKVGDGEKMSDLKSFATTRKGTAVNFFVIGDTQATDTSNTDEITKILSNDGTDYAFGIQTGDAVDNGGNYIFWENIAKVFAGDFLSSHDIIHVLGNHEYYGDDDASTAASYFNLPNVTDDGSAPICYSTTYGNVYVAAINYVGDANYRKAAEWIKADAAASNATWKILTVHQPGYYTNPSGNNESTAQIFRDLCDEADFDAMFSGHDHSFARTAAMKNGEVNENGTVYYICGSTGEKSYQIVKNDAFHFEYLNGEYNATYITVSATDTELTIKSYDYDKALGQQIIMDTYTKTAKTPCVEAGHKFVCEGNIITCSVCGFAKDAANYTGFAKDSSTGNTMYFNHGVKATGWFLLGDDVYYFDENGIGVTGKKTIDGVTYTFTEESKQAAPVFHVCEDGETRVYVAGEPLHGWQLIDGDYYYLSTNTGRLLKGTYDITFVAGDKGTYKFDKNTGKLLDKTIVTTKEGTKFCYFGPEMLTGWQELGGSKYYFDTETGVMVTGEAEIDGSIYAFSNEGKFLHEGAHDWDGDQCQICGLNTDGTFTSTNKFVAFFQRIFRSIRDLFQRIFGIK